MKNFSGTVTAIATKQLQQMNPYIWLMEFEVPTDPATRYRFTNFETPISRGTGPGGVALTYYPKKIAHGDLSQSAKGDLSQYTINVSHINLEMMAALEAYDGLVNQPVTIRLVNSLALSNPSAESRFDGRISSCRVTQDVASFTIGQSNLQRRQFPASRWIAHHCPWRFGSSECGYVIPAGATNAVGGGFNFCGRTLASCTERGEDEVDRGVLNSDGEADHPLRFGGAPGIQLGESL